MTEHRKRREAGLYDPDRRAEQETTPAPEPAPEPEPEPPAEPAPGPERQGE